MNFFKGEKRPRKVPTHTTIDHFEPLETSHREPLEVGINRLDQAMDPHKPSHEMEKAQGEVLIEEIIKALRSIVGKIRTDIEKSDQYQEEVAKFTGRIRNKYPEAENNAVLHALSLSTPDPAKNLVYRDFPGEDAVKKFVLHLVNKYK